MQGILICYCEEQSCNLVFIGVTRCLCSRKAYLWTQFKNPVAWSFSWTKPNATGMSVSWRAGVSNMTTVTVLFTLHSCLHGKMHRLWLIYLINLGLSVPIDEHDRRTLLAIQIKYCGEVSRSKEQRGREREFRITIATGQCPQFVT